MFANLLVFLFLVRRIRLLNSIFYRVVQIEKNSSRLEIRFRQYVMDVISICICIFFYFFILYQWLLFLFFILSSYNGIASLLLLTSQLSLASHLIG
jgi:hypothetical protein